MVKLTGGFEFLEFWNEVAEIADNLMEECGLEGCQIVLRPVTEEDLAGAIFEEDARAIFSSEERILELALPINPASTPYVEAECCVDMLCQFVDQLDFGTEV